MLALCHGAIATRIVAAALWTPAQYPAGVLATWHDPSAAGGITVSGGTVSADADLSPGGHTESQSTAAKQPIYTTNSLNGFATEHFGNGAVRSLTSNMPSNPTVRSFVVLAYYTGASTATIYGSFISGGVQFRVNNGNMELNAQGVAQIGVSSGRSVPNGAWSIVVASYNTSTHIWSFRLNGSTAGSGSSSQALTSSTTTVGIGYSGGESWGQPIAERLALNNDSLTDLQIAEGYIAWKWGLQTGSGGILPSGHPYYSRAPLTSDPS